MVRGIRPGGQRASAVDHQLRFQQIDPADVPSAACDQRGSIRVVTSTLHAADLNRLRRKKEESASSSSSGGTPSPPYSVLKRRMPRAHSGARQSRASRAMALKPSPTSVSATKLKSTAPFGGNRSSAWRSPGAGDVASSHAIRRNHLGARPQLSRRRCWTPSRLLAEKTTIDLVTHEIHFMRRVDRWRSAAMAWSRDRFVDQQPQRPEAGGIPPLGAGPPRWKNAQRITVTCRRLPIRRVGNIDHPAASPACASRAPTLEQSLDRQRRDLPTFVLNEPRGGVFRHANHWCRPRTARRWAGTIMEPADTPTDVNSATRKPPAHNRQLASC